ncbi:unnamed protein product, partial [Ectocarpus fasciculatus]
LEVISFKTSFRILTVGSSGSGKTNILTNIIHKSSGTFNKIIVYTANKHEPLYKYLESKIDKEMLDIYEGLTHLNSMSLEDLGPGQILIIFDDLVLDKNQGQIESLFIRGRKLSDGMGISCIYLTQSYTLVPKIIRKQASHLIIKKLSSKYERMTIIKEAGNLDMRQLTELYNYCTDGSFTNSYLLI